MVNIEDIKLMIIDDEDDVRISLMTYFEDEGVEVFGAESGEVALSTIESITPDVAIVDVRLPGMDGDMLVQKIHEIIPSIGFILYTGSAEYTPSTKLQQLNINRLKVILKPITDLNILMQAVIDLADGS